MNEQLDDLNKFENKETSHKLPYGWLLLFWGLIGWGAYYLWAYSPGLGGWSQTQDLEGASSAANITATILFTVIPTVAAIAIVAAQRKRK